MSKQNQKAKANVRSKEKSTEDYAGIKELRRFFDTIINSNL